MPTGQVIVTNALISLGIVTQGGAPNASDSQDGINELNDMWSGWSVDDGLIFSLLPQIIVAPTSAAGTAMTAGVSRLYSAEYVNAAGRWKLRIVGSEEYRGHTDLAALALAAEELYWDSNFGSGAGTVFIWPVVAAGNVELQTGAPFTTWTLSANYVLPPGYQDAINYGLALRMISRFGEIVSASTRQYIAQQSMEAQARLRSFNAANRRIQLPESLNPSQTQAALTQQQK